MKKKKGPLQKLSLVSAVLSFILAIISGIMLYLRPENLSSMNPISASLMASTFFFISVAVVLTIIGKADLPSFKFDNTEK